MNTFYIILSTVFSILFIAVSGFAFWRMMLCLRDGLPADISSGYMTAGIMSLGAIPLTWLILT